MLYTFPDLSLCRAASRASYGKMEVKNNYVHQSVQLLLKVLCKFSCCRQAVMTEGGASVSRASLGENLELRTLYFHDLSSQPRDSCYSLYLLLPEILNIMHLSGFHFPFCTQACTSVFLYLQQQSQKVPVQTAGLFIHCRHAACGAFSPIYIHSSESVHIVSPRQSHRVL